MGSKARWFKDRQPSNCFFCPVDNQLGRILFLNLVTVFPWSACVCWRRDLLPAQLATAVSLQLMWKRQQSLSLDWMLLLGGHVLRHSYTLNIFSPSCPFPVYLFYFSYPSKEFFITSLRYVRLFFPFHSFSWHTFSSIHCSRSILHFSGLHSHSWPRQSRMFPLCGSSLGLEV